MISFPLTPERGARLLVAAMRSLGDVVGHPFHGNQYTEGSISDIADKVDVAKSAVGIGPIKTTVHRVGATNEAEVYFAGTHEDAQQYAILHEGHEVKAYPVETKNTLVAVGHHQLYSHLNPGKTLNDALFKAEKPYFKSTGGRGNSVAAFRDVQRKMMGQARKAGYDSVLFKAPPAPAKSELVLLKPKLHTLAAKHVSLIHAAALAHEPKLSVAFRHAFAMGRKALNVNALRNLGDNPGHEFHGNQYTGGGSATLDTLKDKDGFVALKHFLEPVHTNVSPLVDAKVEADEGYRTTIKLTDCIKTEQEIVHGEKTRKLVDKYDKAKEGDAPRFAKNKETGELTLTDGNHRVVAAMLRGDTTISGIVVTLPATKFRGAAATFNPDPVVKVIAKALASTLRPTLLKALTSGGEAGLALLGTRLRAAGDVEGHEFHGNQWTTGGGTSKVEWHPDNKPLLTGTRHPHFVKAMKYVGENHAELLAHTPAIHFVDNEGSKTKHGQFSTKTREINLWEEPTSEGAGRYVQTLVHELTHAKQHAEGRPYHEHEAHSAGKEARKTFNSWSRKRDKLRFGEALLRTAKRTTPTSIDMQFDAKNQHVIDWADRHAAELIDNITETSREAINNAVAQYAEDADWDEFYDEVLAAVGDEARADLIARHESMLAASEGQRQGWDQAVESGLLTGDEQRVWITTPDEKLCPICEGLEDGKAPLGGTYEFDGEEYDGPPAHVGCRCTEGIA